MKKYVLLYLSLHGIGLSLFPGQATGQNLARVSAPTQRTARQHSLLAALKQLEQQ